MSRGRRAGGGAGDRPAARPAPRPHPALSGLIARRARTRPLPAGV